MEMTTEVRSYFGSLGIPITEETQSYFIGAYSNICIPSHARSIGKELLGTSVAIVEELAIPSPFIRTPLSEIVSGWGYGGINVIPKIVRSQGGPV